MNASEFITWFGNELRDLIHTISVTDRFEPSRDLVNRAIDNLKELPSIERNRVKDLLDASHQTWLIGNFRIPYDIRADFDWIEGIVATIEDLLEDWPVGE